MGVVPAGMSQADTKCERVDATGQNSWTAHPVRPERRTALGYSCVYNQACGGANVQQEGVSLGDPNDDKSC